MVSELTPREKQVMDLRQQGYSYLNIAAILGIAIDTVNNHMKAVLRKTGCANFFDLVTSSPRAIESRKRDLRIKALHLSHQLSATTEELRLLGESNEAPVIDFDARAGIACILADMVQGCGGD